MKTNQLDTTSNYSRYILLVMLMQFVITICMSYYYYTITADNTAIYSIHDKASVRLQVFQNMFNIATLINNEKVQELIMQQYNAFMQGAWTYLKHIDYILQQNCDKIAQVQWKPEVANQIKQEVKEKMQQIHDALKNTNPDVEKTQKQEILQQLIDYAQKVNPSLFADLIAIYSPLISIKSQLLLSQVIHEHYNNIIKLPHVTTFLSILDKAQKLQ